MADKYLRLNSTLSSVAAFWKPESPDEVATGNLTVDDNGIHFVTSPEYARGTDVGTPSFDATAFSSIPKIAVMHGFFDQGNRTLLQLMVVKHPRAPKLRGCCTNAQFLYSRMDIWRR